MLDGLHRFLFLNLLPMNDRVISAKVRMPHEQYGNNESATRNIPGITVLTGPVFPEKICHDVNLRIPDESGIFQYYKC